jgi:OOP family OmpA-OmpF porin
MKTLKVFVIAIACSLLFGTENLMGQDSSGSSDHVLVSRYSGSVIDGFEIQDFNEFVLPVGPATRDADGNRIPSEKEVLEGKISRILYLGPDGRSTLEIFRNYQSALEEAGFEFLFTCSGKECGTLFHWLRYKQDVITNTKTSGRAFDSPTDLRYLAAKKTVAGANTYVALMVAIDNIWTKEPVSLLEIVEMEAMDEGMVVVDADAMLEGIEATGHISLYGIYFDTDSATITAESSSTLEEIKTFLNSSPDLKLVVVGHTDTQGGFDHNMDLSQRRAAGVVDALVNTYGVSPDRLRSAGVGYLSPVDSNEASDGRAKNRRVELVKH